MAKTNVTRKALTDNQKQDLLEQMTLDREIIPTRTTAQLVKRYSEQLGVPVSVSIIMTWGKRLKVRTLSQIRRGQVTGSNSQTIRDQTDAILDLTERLEAVETVLRADGDLPAKPNNGRLI